MIATDHVRELPLNLHEYEAAARDVLSPMTFDFVAGGSDDEVTLHGNRAAFGRWRLLPRVLRGLREVSTATSVLGQDISLPVLIAPSALHRLCHEDGERATARAARAAGTIYILSTASSIVMEEVAPEAGPWWFQLYVFADRGRTRDLVARRRGRWSFGAGGDRRHAAARTAGSRRAQSFCPPTRRGNGPSAGA